MTLSTVARLANVSVSTASRALNDGYGISPETRKAVLEAAEACGYFREKKRIHDENRRLHLNVAVLCPEIESVFYSRIAAEIARRLKARGASCLIYNYDFDAPVRSELLSRCMADVNTDAVICFSSLPEPVSPPCKPVISFGGAECYSHIVIDSDEIIECAVSHLLSQGCRKLAFVGEARVTQKETVFRDILRAHGLSPFALFSGPSRFEQAGLDGAKAFLSQASLPDGVVCGYDEIAFGLIAGLAEQNVRVPEDVRVVGINDVPSAPYCFGGLTSVGYDFEPTLSRLIDDLITFAETGRFDVRHDYSVALRLACRNT